MHKVNFKAWKKDIKDFLITVIPAILIGLFITNYIIANVRVPTGSMNNTIPTGSRLMGSRLSYINEEPQRGDIVIFKFPDNEKIYFVKRVIGTPGDIVEISKQDGGCVIVNGTKLEEPYLAEPMAVENEQTFIVPENSYFCMGDNRNDSYDARFWNNTYVKEDKIIAKAKIMYWPKVCKIE